MVVLNLINDYLEALHKLSKAKKAIAKHKDLLKQDFKEKHPEYYIEDIFTSSEIITASIYKTANDERVTVFAHLRSDGDWEW